MTSMFYVPAPPYLNHIISEKLFPLVLVHKGGISHSLSLLTISVATWSSVNWLKCRWISFSLTEGVPLILAIFYLDPKRVKGHQCGVTRMDYALYISFWSGLTYTMSFTLYTLYSIMDAGEVNATMHFIQTLADALRFEVLSFRIMLYH